MQRRRLMYSRARATSTGLVSSREGSHLVAALLCARVSSANPARRPRVRSGSSNSVPSPRPVLCEGQLVCCLDFAFLTTGIARRGSNYRLDAVRIAAGGQGLLRVGKTIFASHEIVE